MESISSNFTVKLLFSFEPHPAKTDSPVSRQQHNRASKASKIQQNWGYNCSSKHIRDVQWYVGRHIHTGSCPVSMVPEETGHGKNKEEHGPWGERYTSEYYAL